MTNLMISFSLLMNMLFMTTKTPTSMGMILMIQIMTMSLTLSLFSINYWFSYILFIVMIGGLMVLFIYMTSLAPNSIFMINMKMIMKIFMIMCLMFILLNMINYNNFLIKNNMEINNFNSILNFNYIMLMKLYNFPINKLTWLMILYLLMTLVIAAKLVKTNLGSLRQLN
uniref:NADH-ubiquinone oxidoreductase chain 6 n=1 Tax=Semidalis aleyrodiformis TaxID=450889 RepID=A0A1S5QXZ1_9NEOP|nr:NADH dehydrogenase subunit 6 [Semidalis aleyrodiformis]